MEDELEMVKKREFNWPLVLWYIHLHALGLYGLVVFFTEAKWLTVLFGENVVRWVHRCLKYELFFYSFVYYIDGRARGDCRGSQAVGPSELSSWMAD